MEIRNPRTTGPSQDLVVCTEHGDFGQEIRSYSCTFCNRGFSNAQALGGHMNVHRKDRARLQESIQEPLFTTDTAKGLNSMGQGEELQSSSDDKGEVVPKRPWTSTHEVNSLGSPIKKDHGVVNSKKPTLELSLSFDSSSASDSYIRSNKVSSLSSSVTEVDLELRLGMDSEATARDRVI